jgi:beta-galactosidase
VDWLRFLKRSSAGETSFRVTADADVFIGVNKNIVQTVSWLQDYEDTKTGITADAAGGSSYAVYRKRFKKDSVIRLRLDASYLVMVLPVTTMQPAYDLKPVTSYRTNVAIVSEGVKKELFAERECAVIKSKTEVTVQWPVQTGVADIYSLTLKYFYPMEKAIQGKLQLIGAGNTMMLEEPVSFTFTRPGKWNQFTINTGTMINAGNYTVKLIIENAEGLAISGIEMQ